MTSMRKLNRRLHRWTQYAQRTPIRRWEIRRVTDGHWHAWSAVQRERSRRGLPNQWDSGPPKPWPGFDPMQYFEIVEPDDQPCFDCGLPDLHNGQGDGIGSCDCTRCEDCGSGPGCECDWAREEEPDDDAGHGDDWRPIETVDTGGLT